MLNIAEGKYQGFCDGVARRAFLKIGALGMGGLGYMAAVTGLIGMGMKYVATTRRAEELDGTLGQVYDSDGKP